MHTSTRVSSFINIITYILVLLVEVGFATRRIRISEGWAGGVLSLTRTRLFIRDLFDGEASYLIWAHCASLG